MDLPKRDQGVDLDDIVHPLCFWNLNTELLTELRPRMPQIPYYYKNVKIPENVSKNKNTTEGHAVKTPSESIQRPETNLGIVQGCETDKPPPLVPRGEDNDDRCAIVPFIEKRPLMTDPQDSTRKSTSEGELMYHAVTEWEFDAADERLLDVFIDDVETLEISKFDDTCKTLTKN